jgi:hypothetical protein
MLRYQVCFLLLLLSLTACSQTTRRVVPAGSIAGVVVDARTGEPIAYAIVYLPGAHIGVKSDENGQFMLNGVPAGPHGVRCGIMGYSFIVLDGVVVEAGQTTELRFELRLNPMQYDGVSPDILQD